MAFNYIPRPSAVIWVGTIGTVHVFQDFSVPKHHTLKSNYKNHFPSPTPALLQFLWWTLGGDTWLIRAMCLLWAHLSVKFGGTIPLSWTERQRAKGAGLQHGGKRHKPVQSETNTSHILTFWTTRVFIILWCALSEKRKTAVRLLKSLEIEFWVQWMWKADGRFNTEPEECMQLG